MLVLLTSLLLAPLALASDHPQTKFFQLRTSHNTSAMVPADFVRSAGTGNLTADKLAAEEVLQQNYFLGTECTVDKNSTLTSMQLCILRNGILDLPTACQIKSLKETEQRARKFNYAQLIHRREPRAPWPHKWDCMYAERTATRPVPGNCYGTFEHFNNTNWERFMYEHINDIRFTFDFVLWEKDKMQNNENRLWYLILYLKQLAINAPDPVRLVETVHELEESVATVGELLTKLKLVIGLGITTVQLVLAAKKLKWPTPGG